MRYRYDIFQNTEEWQKIKLGKFSASSADALLMNKETKGYQSLIDRIVEERITGQSAEGGFKGNQFTERGHELEDAALSQFEDENILIVDRVGVVELDDWVLCSPDGLIGENCLIQVKCPIFKTQMEYLKKQIVPGNYFKQMQFELFVTGREKNIFYSYNPHLPAVSIEINRDEQMIKEIENRLQEAIKEVKDEINFINNLKTPLWNLHLRKS